MLLYVHQSQGTSLLYIKLNHDMRLTVVSTAFYLAVTGWMPSADWCVADPELVWQQRARVQGAGAAPVALRPAALRHLQDRLGLAAAAVHVLHCCHCPVQRGVRHVHGGRLQSTQLHRQRRHCRDALHYRSASPIPFLILCLQHGLLRHYLLHKQM